MTPVNAQDEEARIRTTLEINSFDLATLEKCLIENAYIPPSSEEDAVKEVMYRFYERYIDQAPQFPRTPRLEDLFNPYPYGDAPVDDALGNTKSVREAHKHERESAKYNAVRDLIRIIATRKIQTVKATQQTPDAEQSKISTMEEELKLKREKMNLLERQLETLNATLAAEQEKTKAAEGNLKLEKEKAALLEKQLENLYVTLAVEHDKTSTEAEELKIEREKTDLLEKQVKSLQTKYQAVQRLVDESYDSELERIENVNHIRGPRRSSGFLTREDAATAAVEEETPRTPPPASTRRPAIYLTVDEQRAATAAANEIAQGEEEKKRAAEEEEARVLRNRIRRQRLPPKPKSEPAADTPEAVSQVEILGEPSGPLLNEDDATIPLEGNRAKVKGKRKRSKKETAVELAAEERSKSIAGTPGLVQYATRAVGRPKGSGLMEKIR
jgi:hypothetical protein